MEYNVTDEATRKLHDCVRTVKVSPEARDEYMLLEEKLFYERRDGREEGQSSERIRIIKTMLSKGKIVEEIADLLELSVDDVRNLVDKIE